MKRLGLFRLLILAAPCALGRIGSESRVRGQKQGGVLPSYGTKPALFFPTLLSGSSHIKREDLETKHWIVEYFYQFFSEKCRINHQRESTVPTDTCVRICRNGLLGIKYTEASAYGRGYSSSIGISFYAVDKLHYVLGIICSIENTWKRSALNSYGRLVSILLFHYR